MNTAQGQGDADLFIVPPELPPLPRVVPPPAQRADPTIPATQFEVPQNLAQFAELRRLKTRGKVPDTAVHLWTHLLKHYLVLANQAQPQDKEHAILRFLLLPHMFLPRNASTTRIVNHMQTISPFAVNLNRPSTRQVRQHEGEHRLTEAVTRLAADFKMRAANRLLQTVAETNELTPQEKVDGFKKKVIEHSDFVHKFPPKQIPIISTAEVTKAISKLNRQAAEAVDGYTKDLLSQAINSDREIATELGVLLHHILTSPLSPRLRQMLLLSRGVAIPKPDGGGIRPICVSSIFIKLLGTICTERDGKLPSHHQYAIGSVDGHKRIIHKIRSFIETTPDAAVLKFDISNAYGSLPRTVIQQALSDSDPALQHYFTLVYGSPSTIVR